MSIVLARTGLVAVSNIGLLADYLSWQKLPLTSPVE